MIAFFDYLVQQEIEGWSSESSSHNSDHSSDNSSRPDSPTSDTEPTHFAIAKPPLGRHHRGKISISFRPINYSLNILENHRRGESSQRHKYRNRIAYLIATKRKTLKRLALKRVTRTPARRIKNKYVPRQTKRTAMRATGRKPYDKKMRRLSVQSKYKKPVSHEQTSDSEVPQKKKRRTQSYTATSSYRTFRRKAKTPLSSASNTSTRVADKSDSSSDYDDDYDGFGGNGNLPSTSTAPILDVNIPSTSTGITANGKGFLFRIAHAANDSDDDQSIPDTSHPADNMLRVLRSPPMHNNNNNHRAHYQSYDGGHDPSTSSQRGSFFNSSSLRHQHEVPPNGRKKAQAQEDDSSSSKCVEDYASTNSNSLMSSTEESSNDSCPDFYGKKRRLNGDENDAEGPDDAPGNHSSSLNHNKSFKAINKNYANGAGTSSSNGLFGTPSNRLKMTPDSGNSSLPTPSPSSSRGSTCNGSDVAKKIEIIKRNYRKNIQTSDDDSD